MCERYFIEFPPEEPMSPESLLEESLALVQPKDICLHHVVFFIPFEPTLDKPEKKRIWSRSKKASPECDPGAVLRNNIKFMIRKTKHFGLLLTQLTWVGIMNFAEKRSVLQQCDDDMRTAALYIIMLKKEATGLTQFINCLHMTGNHEIANIIESKLELLVENFEYDEYGNFIGFENSVDEWHGHFLPPKKRKTSADSGFDDISEEREIRPTLINVNRFQCNIKPLDAVDVIAIINGKEDSKSKVELCKCGHYHQYPKWKYVNGEQVPKESNYMISSGIAKYFAKMSERRNAGPVQVHKGILSPGAQPVEVGSDLSHGHAVSDGLEFTQPRRSCPQLRLRFSNANSYSEHPDNAQTTSGSNCSTPVNGNTKLKNKLPKFLQLFI